MLVVLRMDKGVPATFFLLRRNGRQGLRDKAGRQRQTRNAGVLWCFVLVPGAPNGLLSQIKRSEGSPTATNKADRPTLDIEGEKVRLFKAVRELCDASTVAFALLGLWLLHRQIRQSCVLV